MRVKAVHPRSRFYKSVFVALLQFMHGDADGETTVRRILDYEGIFALYQFEKAWFALHRDARGDMRTSPEGQAAIRALPGYAELFGDDFEWPPDNIDYSPDTFSDYRGYTLYWYTQEGIEHRVELIEEED